MLKPSTNLAIYITDEATPYVISAAKRPYTYSHGYASIVKFCPKCQKVWAALRFADDEVMFPDSLSCVRCNLITYPTDIPGSILNDHLLELLNHFPRELLLREFALHLKAIENDRGNQ